jgi:excisionase family DNA binding protein
MTSGSSGDRINGLGIFVGVPSNRGGVVRTADQSVEDAHDQRVEPMMRVAFNSIECYAWTPAGNNTEMTSKPSHVETVLHAASSEADELRALRDRIDAALRGSQAPYVLGPDAGGIELPVSVLEALKLIIDILARGQSITLVPHDKALTSQEAADILHVSRPHLIKLLDRGELPFHKVGSHRRLKIEDVLTYRERRDAARDAALSELTRLSEELPGGYR